MVALAQTAADSRQGGRTWSRLEEILIELGSKEVNQTKYELLGGKANGIGNEFLSNFGRWYSNCII